MKRIILQTHSKLMKSFFLFFFLLLIIAGVKYYGLLQEKTYKVLVIHSYRGNFFWKEELNKGITDCFKRHWIKTRIAYEYMDSEVLIAEAEEEFVRSLLDAQAADAPDLILVCGDQATYSLLVINHPLIHQVPVVFSGVNYLNPRLLEKYTQVTGFTTEPDFVKCIELIKYIYPQITQFSLNITERFMGKSAEKLFKQQTASLSDTCLVRSMETNTKGTVSWDATHLSSEGAIIPVWDSFYSSLVNNFDFPCFVVNNEGLEGGYLGGYMTPPYRQTYLATERGIQILRGMPISDLPVVQSPQIPVFNWDVMQRFHITPKQLPLGSEVINMPFYERHKFGLIFFGGLFVLLVTGGTAQLLRLYQRERVAKKKAWYHLQDHKNKLDITMKSIREGVISFDRELRIFTINRAALQWLGFDPKSPASLCIGRDIRSLLNISRQGDELFLDTILTHLFTNYQETMFESDCQFHSLASGYTFSIDGELSGIYQDGELYGAVLTFHDVTQEIIRKEFLALTLSAGNIFCWQFNWRTKMFTFDKAFFAQSHLSCTDSQEIGFAQIKALILPEDLEVLRGAIKEIRTHKPAQITRQIRANMFGKEYTWWEFRLTVLPGYDKYANNLIYGLLFNIQSYKEIETELIQAYIKAEQSERLKSAFLANMSHEIRTPLNGIVGFSNLLTSGEDYEPEEVQMFVDTIRKNCGLLLALISDILDLASIESNSMSFSIVSCDVNELIRQIVTTQRVIVPAHLKLICEIPKQTVYMNTDPLRLNQVLTNLINNAVKFTSQGTITVGYMMNEPGYLTFFVEDTGRGISQEDLNSVFLRFFKKDDFTQGAGLGLSICKIIVDRFNGIIGVTSELGKGTRFTVRVPQVSGKHLLPVHRFP